MLYLLSAAGQRLPRPVVLSLLINAGLPLALYTLLSPHMSTLHAVLLIALVPLGESLVSLVRRRRVDAVSLVVLATLVLGGAIVALGGSARLILVREQLLTGALGLGLLCSLILPRPLMFYLLRPVVGRHDPTRRARFDARWASSSAFRRLLRLTTLVFGVGIVGEAVINTYLAFTQAIPTFLALSPIVRYGIAGGVVLWLVLYVRRVKRATGQNPLAIG